MIALTIVDRNFSPGAFAFHLISTGLIGLFPLYAKDDSDHSIP